MPPQSQFPLPPGATAVDIPSQFALPPGNTAVNTAAPVQQFPLPPGATPADEATPPAAGLAGGFMKPQASLAVGAANLLAAGAEKIFKMPKGSLQATETNESPLTTSGKVGDAAGELAQWMSAEGVVSKGAKFLGETAKMATEIQEASKYIKTATGWGEFLAEHPQAAWLVRAIRQVGGGAALGAATGGGLGAVQGAATQQTGEDAKTGAEWGGVSGAVAPTLAAAKEVAPAVKGAAGDLFSKMSNPFRKLTGSDIQPTIKAGIQDVWNQTADSAGVPRPTTASVQDMGQEVGDAILARSKAAYKLIDGATDGRFSGTEQALKTVNQDLRSVTNDVQEQELLTRKTRLEMQMDQMMDDAEAKGVPKPTIDAAKADFKKAQAIYDTNHQIRMSTTGVRPGMQGATDAPEEVNAKSLLNRTNKLYNSGRLQQAIGDDGSEDLIGHSAKALKMTKNVARNRKIAGAAAGLGGIEAVRHLIP